MLRPLASAERPDSQAGGGPGSGQFPPAVGDVETCLHVALRSGPQDNYGAVVQRISDLQLHPNHQPEEASSLFYAAMCFCFFEEFNVVHTIGQVSANFLDSRISLIFHLSTAAPALYLAAALPPKELIPRIVFSNLTSVEVTHGISIPAVRNMVILTEHMRTIRYRFSRTVLILISLLFFQLYLLPSSPAAETEDHRVPDMDEAGYPAKRDRGVQRQH
ncbi:uncharacterized protein Dana_GF27141 [Drosophila ananassae]|uniref:Uncharacterized protein n=1 Tax=Drosophila ananassae TaxID=7217 RepID=A0A0P9BTB5_DROAN|nr:uncharacterized protein LOC26514550 [Drosophila ananassae]KPU74914.1 uncharacterized protein Dana_GF27141 [Drosophila ananassae]